MCKKLLKGEKSSCNQDRLLKLNTGGFKILHLCDPFEEKLEKLKTVKNISQHRLSEYFCHFKKRLLPQL